MSSVPVKLSTISDAVDTIAFTRLRPKLIGTAVWEVTAKYENTRMGSVYEPIAEGLYGLITRPKWHPDPVGIARLYANASKTHPKIKGVFLDDLVDQLAKGQWTVDLVKQIIATIRGINPNLKIQTTYYPHWKENPATINQFDIDEIWFGCCGPDVVANLDSMFNAAVSAFPGKTIWGAVNPRSEFEGQMTDAEWRTALTYFRNAYYTGRIQGISIYNAIHLNANPHLIDIALDVLARHALQVNSAPVQGIPFTLERMA